MVLSDICVRRPVLATVLSLVLTLVGIVYYSKLTLRHYPQVDRPIVAVTTQYEGASSEIIEGQVTKIIENALFGIQGLQYMSSRSLSEESKITLVFDINRNLDSAASDVRDRLGRVQSQLPQGIKFPEIKKADADAQPVLYLVLSSDNLPIEEVSNYADKKLKNELEAVPDVARVEVSGLQEKVVHVKIDPIKLASYHLTVQDVGTALRNQNINIPAGRVSADDREFMVTTTATLTDPDEFQNIIIKNFKGYLVRLGDIAKIEFSANENRSLVYFNGRQAVGLGLIKTSIGNPLEISKNLRSRMKQIREVLPKGMRVNIAMDNSIFINKSLEQVKKTILEAIVFVLVVIGLFLWSVRASIIPLVTIPVSLISTCMFLYLFGFSLNTLTLLALVLAIGLVVDDAIVVMENAHRYIEEGLSPIAATIKGTREISMAVIAMTLTLAAVYAPIAMAPGFTGKLFVEFAVALACSVIVSGFVALTLSPMMCAKILKPHKKGEADNISERTLKRVENAFEKFLNNILRQRSIIILFGLLFTGLGYFVGGKLLKSELAPAVDQGVVMVYGNPPQSSTITYVDRYTDKADEILTGIPEIQGRLEMVDVTRPTIINTLKDWTNRDRSSTEIVKDIREKLKEISGVRFFPTPGSNPLGSSGGGNDDGISFVVQTSKGYKELDEGVKNVVRTLYQHGGFSNILTGQVEVQDYSIKIDRDKAAALGIDISTLADTLSTLIKGKVITKLRQDSEEYKVITEVSSSLKKGPEDLNNIFVKGVKEQKEAMIPLSNLITFEKRSQPAERYHYNKLRASDVSARLGDKFTIGEAVKFIDEQVKPNLPEGITIEYVRSTRNYLESKNTIYFIFGMALLFIYLVMAAQFESFRDPFIIILSVPLSITGALITLYLVKGTLNIFSQIGLVSLIGLITKHGILMVDFANVKLNEGMEATKAIVHAAKQRLRPILMTTAAMVLGAFPLAISRGAGAEGNQQIGWVIVGGMIIGTFFTLFVLPAVYSYLAKPKKILDQDDIEEKLKKYKLPTKSKKKPV